MSTADDGRAPGAGPDLRPARVVALGLLVSKPGGYLRDALLAARFGTGPAMDAYALATTVAVAAFDIIGTPLQRILVPVLVRARTERGRAGLESSSTAIFWATIMVALCVGLLLLALAGPLAAVLAGGGGLSGTVATLIRWLALLPTAMALAAFATGWLQAGEHFTLPAFVGIPYDIGIVGCVLLFPRHGVLAAAWGLLLGTIGQFLLQWPGLRIWGHRVRPPDPAAALADPGLRTTAMLAAPLLVSAGCVQAVNLLQQGLAARLGEGAVSALTFAYRMLDLPSALFILPVMTVVLPRLAALFAARRDADARHALDETAWALSAGLIPCALLMGLLAPSVASALYEHGAFNAASVAAMAAALVGFAPGVLTFGLQQLMRTYFYAREDAATPMRWDLAALAVSAVCDLLAFHLLRGLGLALGWSVGAAVGWLGLTRAARAVRPGRAPSHLRAIGLGCLALVVVVLVLRGHVPPFLGHAPWRRGVADICVRGLGGALAYALATMAGGGRGLFEVLVGSVRRRPHPAEHALPTP